MISTGLVYVLVLCSLTATALRLSGTGNAVRSSSLKMMFNFFNNNNANAASKSVIPANKKICVITGTSSGLGKETAKALLSTEDYFVICACRDVAKMQEVAKKEGFDEKNHMIMELDLSSLDSVRKFTNNLKKVKTRPLDRLVCNAAVYQPALAVVSTSNQFRMHVLMFHPYH